MALTYCRWKEGKPEPSEIKEQIMRDVHEALDIRDLTLSEVCSGSHGVREAEAREAIAVIFFERVGSPKNSSPTGGEIMSASEMARLVGISRTTLLTARKRWSRKHAEQCPGPPARTRSIEPPTAG